MLPRNTTAYSAITRPRNAPSEASCKAEFSAAIIAIRTKPSGTRTTSSSQSCGMTAASTSRSPVERPAATIRRSDGLLCPATARPPIREPMPVNTSISPYVPALPENERSAISGMITEKLNENV